MNEQATAETRAQWKKLEALSERLRKVETGDAAKEERMQAMERSLERLHKEIAAARTEARTTAETASSSINALETSFVEARGEIRGSVRTLAWIVGTAVIGGGGLLIAAIVMLAKLGVL